MSNVMPKTDEHAAVRERFHAWCRQQGINADLWMPNQPWCGYSNSRVNDYWTGFLAAHGDGAWTKTADKMPKEGTEAVILWENTKLVYVAHYTGVANEWRVHSGGVVTDPTHYCAQPFHGGQGSSGGK